MPINNKNTEKACYKCGSVKNCQPILLPIEHFTLNEILIKFSELFCCPKCIKAYEHDFKRILAEHPEELILNSWKAQFPTIEVNSTDDIYWLLNFSLKTK